MVILAVTVEQTASIALVVLVAQVVEGELLLQVQDLTLVQE
jgi:hypothetical protein